ncbi:MAG TPA: Mur ligase family protein [Verrucomicrobiae bacterium]|nr:Mur ligase family protein [Verrucomicrobiae bacterium]
MTPNIRTLYDPRSLATTLAYMLQNVEYGPGAYLHWLWRTRDFSRVMYRRELDMTHRARLLRLCVLCGSTLQIIIGLALLVLSHWFHVANGILVGLILVLSYPVVWAHVIVVPLWIAHELLVKPQQARLVATSQRSFAKFAGPKIAIAGSYGKTSMKELLSTVLSEGLHVATTPANKNVAVSHAQFARTLQGSEDVLIIEYGEGRPGDVARFVATTQPTHGIITGLAPAHLDQYKTLHAAGEDIFSLANYLHGNHVYVNADSPAVTPFRKKAYLAYSVTGALGWRVSNVKVAITGTDFMLTKGKQKLALHSHLLGRHQVGPLSLAAALGIELGLTASQVEAGIAKALPYEHRMQPYKLGEAWIIDDTYNGNLEGVRAGTALLAALPAKRKLYVTPGLVDQGIETQRVHEEMGRLIAQAQPDIVILMRNSSTPYIQAGLEAGMFKGTLHLEDLPLEFYQNLNQYVVTGDVVLMQNDWTDNYA